MDECEVLEVGHFPSGGFDHASVSDKFAQLSSLTTYVLSGDANAAKRWESTPTLELTHALENGN